MGLGSYWGEVIDVLREIIPIYDKVNSFISLGKDVEHRNRAINGRVKKGDKILDAGSGFGNMSKTAAKIVDSDLRAFCGWVTALFGVSVHAQTSPEALVSCVGKLRISS